MPDDMLDPLSRLLAENNCRALVVIAAHLIDSGEFTRLPSAFSADATLVRPDGTTLSGCDAIIASYAARPAERISRHLIQGTNFIEVTANTAVAATQVLLWSGSTNDEAGQFGRPARGRQVVGRFNDEFARTDGVWRITKRVASFELFVDIP
ncbi:hypothetical protein CI15_20625 [Paraburkholderia monticola]|uniref:SnoaL-like domain-containing protein n=1 Tax=Paraburkholderia monticola TaxID=1399968 RepID=A0A149PKJ6_9BURK|nr:nuclear transport factor 2 family protein [Paraburkholderia monticola]KXU85561.1 hypothetical protein CI15_20625 [Paraburkholderia monticola]